MARNYPLEKLRNFGIVAHVDAGKTTTSERILYYTGESHKIGEVHDGETVTDWMEQERERGITITAAAISCDYQPSYTDDADKKVTFNIIDTPGHIDFTAEVKRSMYVLDGAVVVFDAAAGVEPQTETNWRYADEAGVPRICFLNKMDKLGADFETAYASIQEKLSDKAVRLQIPMGHEEHHLGAIDLLKMKAYTYEGEMGKDVIESDIPEQYIADAEKYRGELIERIVEDDEDLMDKYLRGEDISYETLAAQLRKAVIATDVFPVMCGSAFKNKGVQKVLDAVVDYLPAPTDLPPVKGINPNNDEEVERKPSDEEPLSALAFKLQTDPFVGQLTFIRVYSGVMKSGETYLNTGTGKKERIGRIVRLMADKRDEITEVYTGEIAAVVGAKDLKMSHTLCPADEPIVLEEMTFPEPVISARVEPKTKADQEKMGLALSKLSDEDPTFKVHTDEETNETVMSGMGELHLDILVDRMKREFGVEADLGRPQVAYRETIQGTADVDNKYIKQTGGRGQYGHVKIRIVPLQPEEEAVEGEKKKKKANNIEREDHFEFINNIKGGVIPSEYMGAIKKGFKEAMGRGVLAGYPMEDISVDLYDGSFHDVDSSEIAFKIAASQALKQAAQQANPAILEPIMKVEVTTPEQFMGDVNGNLSSRRGVVEGMEPRGNAQIITAKVPLSEMFGYTTALRSMTEGRANVTMEFSNYAVVPKNVADEIITQRG
ncbi:MAG: elongation factor G [Candidatus Pacebacteria bacterium]|nr:elongation factor G [Candidatus Paceibacterota bacterium]